MIILINFYFMINSINVMTILINFYLYIYDHMLFQMVGTSRDRGKRPQVEEEDPSVEREEEDRAEDDGQGEEAPPPSANRQTLSPDGIW